MKTLKIFKIEELEERLEMNASWDNGDKYWGYGYN